MQFTSNYDSRVINYKHKMFIRLATDCFLEWVRGLAKQGEWGSDCGAVDRAVASNSRSPWFDSNQRQNFVQNMFYR